MDSPRTSARQDFRRQVLVDLGARDSAVDELLEYNRNPIEEERFAALPPFPLADEPQLEAWQEYAREAEQDGPLPALARRIVQLQFAISEGVSDSEVYKRATRRGIAPGPLEGGTLTLAHPEGLELQLHPSLAGTIPLLVPASREDFVSLARVFSARSEPRPIPDSMGACMVAGLNNWDRVNRYRQQWEAADPTNHTPDQWSAEFKRLIPRKELYQDRFIVLSRGPYSNVAAADAGLEHDDWVDLSLRIRREHECTHYFTLRVFGKLQHNILEELLSDFVGLVVPLSEYRADLALRFLGLEEFPSYREGGRMENYRGDPPLSDAAFEVLTRLVHTGVHNLAEIHCRHAAAAASAEGLARLVAVLTSLTMEELAAEDAATKVDAAMG